MTRWLSLLARLSRHRITMSIHPQHHFTFSKCNFNFFVKIHLTEHHLETIRTKNNPTHLTTPVLFMQKPLARWFFFLSVNTKHSCFLRYGDYGLLAEKRAGVSNGRVIRFGAVVAARRVVALPSHSTDVDTHTLTYSCSATLVTMLPTNSR